MRKHLSIFFFLAYSVTYLFAQQGGFKVIDDRTLTPDELKAFKEITEQRVDELQLYIIKIGDKKTEKNDKDLAVTSALQLFTPTAKIEVTFKAKNVTKRITSFTMEDYFYRLSALPYARVEITFYNIAYVGKFMKGADGKYYASATIFQEFKGFNAEGILVYSDKQQKQINIVLEYKFDTFYNQWQWTVLFDDIKATDTAG